MIDHWAWEQQFEFKHACARIVDFHHPGWSSLNSSETSSLCLKVHEF